MDYKDLGNGITCIETGYERQGLASCYLVEQDGEFALIDTGTAHTVKTILQLFKQRGIGHEQVRYIIPTHVHLDHAGGAGQLMRLCENAELIIHPFGSRHMIDPTKLQAGATAVYGEEAFKKSFDTLLPIDANRVTEMNDGMYVNLNGRILELIDTPGHARHHLCVWDEKTKGLFTGDVFGNGYPELKSDKGRYLMPVTSPVQLDPPAWHYSIDKLLSFDPERIYLTHYGLLEDPVHHAQQLHKDLDSYVKIALNVGTTSRYEHLLEQITKYHMDNISAHGCEQNQAEAHALICTDLVLCAQGLDIWLDRQSKTKPV